MYIAQVIINAKKLQLIRLISILLRYYHLVYCLIVHGFPKAEEITRKAEHMQYKAGMWKQKLEAEAVEVVFFLWKRKRKQKRENSTASAST